MIINIFIYFWFSLSKIEVTNSFDLVNSQFVKNLNPDAYFTVYSTSYDRLNTIAQDIGYIGDYENLSIPDGAKMFIQDVKDGNTILEQGDEDYNNVINIDKRKQRLTENNLIVSTSFRFKKDSREGLADNTFFIFRSN